MLFLIFSKQIQINYFLNFYHWWSFWLLRFLILLFGSEFRRTYSCFSNYKIFFVIFMFKKINSILLLIISWKSINKLFISYQTFLFSTNSSVLSFVSDSNFYRPCNSLCSITCVQISIIHILFNFYLFFLIALSTTIIWQPESKSENLWYSNLIFLNLNKP